jgi:hypothetical protein
MLGAMRLLEARIGQLLGPAERGEIEGDQIARELNEILPSDAQISELVLRDRKPL